MQYWIGVAGTMDGPIEDDWRPAAARWIETRGEVHMCKGRPTIRPGDRLIMYATGSPARFGAGRIFAVREVVGDPEPSTDERWPWKVPVRQVIAGPNLSDCPTLDDIGLPTTSVRRQTHIRLDGDAGQLAEELLTKAGGAVLQ